VSCCFKEPNQLEEEGGSKMEWLKKFMKEEDGVTAIEYTLIAVLIALAIVTAVTGVGTWVDTQMTSVAGLPGAGGGS